MYNEYWVPKDENPCQNAVTPRTSSLCLSINLYTKKMDRYQLNADPSLVGVVVCSQSARLSSKSPNVEYKDDVMSGVERLPVLNTLNQLSFCSDNGAPVD
jgi:hypothetical protein